MSVIKNSYNGDSEHNRYIVELPISYADAEEYIKVLEVALAFAKRVNDYIINNDWT